MVSYCKNITLAIGVASFAAGCSDINQDIPAGVEDPRVVESELGALALARGAMATFARAYESYISASALFTDELHQAEARTSAYTGMVVNTIDGRGDDSNNTYHSYTSLQAARNSTDAAMTMLRLYGNDKHHYTLSELYSAKAYSLLLLSELFCSGIPLSTIDFQEDFTYTKGYSFTEMQHMALSLLDSALILAGDSLPLQLHAKVGAARANMNLGLYEEAAIYLNSIAPSDAYVVPIGDASRLLSLTSVPFREGGNGLDFRGSDPRITYDFINISTSTGDSVFRSSKYRISIGSNQSKPIVVASMIHVILMEAEITLSTGSHNWIDMINTLRTDGSFRITGEDTVWNKGVGGIENLPPVPAPANHSSSVDLLFRERAFWLYLTGNRQGDMRRLIRQYDRDPEAVYPTGSYGINGSTLGARYGNRVVFAVPEEEARANPLYSGCLSEEA